MQWEERATSSGIADRGDLVPEKFLTYPNKKNTSRHVVTCTPGIAFGADMLNYIESQRNTPKKQWIFDIIAGKKEVSRRLLETPDYVLLPDTEAPNDNSVVNLLAIFKDCSLHTMRNLRGEHIKMLEECRDQCMAKICECTDNKKSNIISYFHYLPSVFQLHLHFCAPYGHYTTQDICKIHPIDNVISNLKISGDYYAKAEISTVIIGNGDLAGLYNVKT